MTDERTPLVSDEQHSRYLHESTAIRRRQRRFEKLQCFICAIIISICITLILLTITYGIIKDGDDSVVNSTDNSSENAVYLLFQTNWPIEDVARDGTCFENLSLWDNITSYKLNDSNNHFFDTTHPSYKHQKSFISSDTSKILAEMGYAQEQMIKTDLQMYIQCTYARYRRNKQVHNCRVNNTNRYNYHLNTCNEFYIYRTYNGSCNNLKYPEGFGAAFNAFRRCLQPEYADGISKPKDLPSARTVSVAVNRPIYRNDHKFTVMLAVWGQFLDHDITATALYQDPSRRPILCCVADSHQECFPVAVDKTDPYYGKYNISCLEFVRSAPAPTINLGPREQFTQVSAFIDGSVIYGSDERSVRKLRTMKNGTLKMFITENGRSLLPFSTDPNDGCNRAEEESKGHYCFMTGDSRSNENLHLISMHLIWARQHNRVASQLYHINPHWDDERLFQETRRIIGAQMQHITYNEFLNILLGPELMKQTGIEPKLRGYYNDYNEKVDATIANNFATAAFRFGHTLLPSLMKLLKKDGLETENVQLHKYLFNPFDLYQEGPDRNLRGAITSFVNSGSTFSPEIQHRLFESTNSNGTKVCGLDLVSLNIQRGRDHGLPGYVKWRKYCNLRHIATFNDFNGEIDEETLKRMEEIYGDVAAIDLYVGAVSERPLKGGILGPTFTCLILDQFVRLKKGDRFWYENAKPPQAFTATQLQQLRTTSLAGIICDNSDDVDHVQPKVMRPVGEGNKYTPCSEIPRTDLTKWKDADLPHIFISDPTLNVKSMKLPIDST